MTKTKEMPYEKGLEHGLDFLMEGYDFILNRRIALQSDVFETRLLGQKAICMGGEEAAELFYDNDKFKREGAMPNRIQQTLVGKDGVQSLDGAAHAHRKKLFMSLMSEKDLQRMDALLEQEWQAWIDKMTNSQEELVLYEEMKTLLMRAACRWAGVSLEEDEVKRRTRQVTQLFESPAALGPKHWKGRNARNLADKWIRDVVREVRDGTRNPPEHTALYAFSNDRDENGNHLPVNVAAVEVLNMIRPITAISVYVAFTALALHQQPEWRARLQKPDALDYQHFVQEVRRFFPFFPVQAAITKKDFVWNGYLFKQGTLTLLDLYGTNHDPKGWDNPQRFNPDRFQDWNGSPFSFIPQGGGDHLAGHRCAGEWITIRVMNICLHHLVNSIQYEVPAQDLSYKMNQIPSIPKDGFKITKLKKNGQSPL